jgi:hypothetical protein
VQRINLLVCMLTVGFLTNAQTTSTLDNLAQVSMTDAQTAAIFNKLQRSTNPHISQYAYILKDSVWPQTSLYVCWENPEDRFKDQMAIVQKAVHDTWRLESKLEFTGWAKCAQKNHGIHIFIDDSGPLTRVLGRQLDEMKNGMVLNFTFAKWSPYCQAKQEYCVRGIAIHEFGHAIGFAHEQNSPSAPGECQILKTGPNGDESLTPYDPHSVMNYCFMDWTDGNLSPLDKAAVKELYGARDSTPSGGG